MAIENTQKTKKDPRPPYPSYTSFRNYIKKLSDTIVPSQIDRSVFGNQSGTYISLMIGTFEWFGLINENGRPTEKLKNLVGANDSEYPEMLKALLLDSYDILREEKIDLRTGTEHQISKIFRDYGFSGSTLTKAITFFLSACKDAGYQIGDHMRAPSPPRGNGSKRKPKGEVSNGGKETPLDCDTAASGDLDQTPEGMERITVPLRNMDDGVIYFPAGLTPEEAKRAVKAAVFNLQHYYELDD